MLLVKHLVILKIRIKKNKVNEGVSKNTNKKRNILLFLHICFCFVQNRVLNTTFRTAYFLFLTLEVPFFIPHLSSRALRASFICFTPEFFPARLGKVFFRQGKKYVEVLVYCSRKYSQLCGHICVIENTFVYRKEKKDA